MKTTAIEWRPLTAVHPYEKNARINDDAVPRVAESIRQFGFVNPIVVDADGVILAGHTRYRAAQSLGLETVPVLVAADLDDAKARAFRLADNKTAEYSKWDIGLLVEELDDLSAYDVNMSDFGFDTSEMFRRRSAWARLEKLCDLKRNVKQHLHGGISYATLFQTGKRGMPLEKIKADPANAPIFADCVADYLSCALGENLSKGDWCMLTTPRRRHRDGFHFSTAVTQAAAQSMRLPFYSDAFTAADRSRIDPNFEMKVELPERNVILVDDIITTGQTIRSCRQLLLDHGHVVLSVIGIKNS